MKRVCAYARVSTASRSQEHSFDFQSEYWNKTLGDNPEYSYVGLYADKGISGKFANRRPQFMAMMGEALSGKIDIIFCKSVQRFSRNTEELLTYVRQLREVGVAVIFEKEKINTIESKSDLYLTIAVAVAEDDLSRYAQNVSWSSKDKAKKGEGSFGGRFYGYYCSKGQKVEINEEEATIVRMIFNDYLSGMTTGEITKKLYSLKIKSPKDRDKWSPNQVLSIIQNEKYKGDMLLQKYYSKNGVRKKNNGETERYYVSNHHEAIVSEEIWDKAQEETKRRSKEKLLGTHVQVYPFTGLIYCGCCGRPYQHRVCNFGGDYRVNYYRCSYAKDSLDNIEKCNGSQIKESVLHEKFVSAYNEFVLNGYKGAEENKILKKKEAILKEKDELERLFINGWVSRSNYETELKEINKRIDECHEELNSLKIRKISDKDFKPITEFDENKVSKFLSKVKVYEHRIEFEFYNGVVVERTFTNRKKVRKDGITCAKWREYQDED